METSLTTWEAKERAGLLALEMEEWRGKRLIAEDPNTTAEVLTRLITEVGIAVDAKVRNEPYISRDPFDLIADSLAVHPNIPPEQILKYYWLTWDTALCHNPVAPLLCLEIPDFWLQLSERACVRFLSDEALPYSAAFALTHHPNEQISQEALLHISLAGEISSRGEGLCKITDYWREFCRSPKPYRSPGIKYSIVGERDTILEWHYELVRLGLAPTWATPSEPFQKQYVLRRSLCNPVFHLLIGMTLWDIFTRQGCLSFRKFVRQLILEAVDCRDAGQFVEFVAMLHDVYKGGLLQYCLKRENWWDRLRAALRLPLSDQPFKNDDWNRSPLDLLQHLAHDGNSFVRWAAQTRLADPDFVFTWRDEYG